MNLLNLIDGPSALVVFGGTALATVLRAGLRDCGTTLSKLSQLGRKQFDLTKARGKLARQVQEIHQDGLLRAQPRQFGDSEFDQAADLLTTRRSVPALLAAHEAHKARRLGEAERAVRTLSQAAELSPVFGLAGTLVSLSQLPAEGIARGSFTGAISMAVVTTLYGLLGANLLLAPLARIIERKACDEEAERQQLIDWLAEKVTSALPPRALRPRPAADAA